jgi:hypothetical protein
MKNLNKFLLSLSLIFTSSLIQLDAQAFDKFITVKFKTAPTDASIKELYKMTNTVLVKKEAPATYILKLAGIGNNDTLDHYSELFTIMQNVANVSPVPKEKTDDKVNPYYYMNNSLQNSSVSKNNSNEAQNTEETRIINDELIVKYYSDVPDDQISIINNFVGGETTLIEGSDSYKVKLPENIDPDTAISIFENSGKVESVEQNKVTVKNDAAAQAPANDKYSASSNQSGIITTIPLNKRDVKVTFKIGEEQEAMNWFNDVFGSQLVAKKGFSSFILRFPENINPKMVVRALKVCSSVASVEVSSD